MNGCKIKAHDDTIPATSLKDGQLAVLVSGNTTYTGCIVMRHIYGTRDLLVNIGKAGGSTWFGPVPSGLRVRPLKAGEQITVN